MVDDMTDANIIIAVVNRGEILVWRGLITVLIANKQLATAILKPEEILVATLAATT